MPASAAAIQAATIDDTRIATQAALDSMNGTLHAVLECIEHSRRCLVASRLALQRANEISVPVWRSRESPATSR